jgi:hypothetical protein
MKIKIMLLAYLAGAILTYGYACKEGVKENIRRWPSLGKEFGVSGDALIESAV